MAIVYSKRYLNHDPGPFHPERKERLLVTYDYLKSQGLLERCSLEEPREASDEELLLVHSQRYLRSLASLCAHGGGRLDPDTQACRETYEVAKLAAGGCIRAGELLLKERCEASFALIRPPGHHASREAARGFCFLNNPVVVIRSLQRSFGLRKIFLLDWDAHAFDGTMELLYKDPSVLKVSLHQDPRSFYPGTGFLHQLGSGEGEGYTINLPLQQCSGDADYILLLESFVIPIVEEFKPELIVVSAGFDSHIQDAISGLCLSERGYAAMTSLLLEEARKHCRGKLLLELEGGYNLQTLATSVESVLRVLLGESVERPRGEASKSTVSLLREAKDIFRNYFDV